MAATELQNRSGVRIGTDLIDEFAAGLAGRLIRPADADYDEARRIWNAAIDRHPGLISRCLGVGRCNPRGEIRRANDLLVAVRGGGHNVAGRALCDNGLVVDLSAMRGVLVEPETRTVRVQGGATLGDLDRETHLHGLAVPVGVVSKTGVAGLTLGGGVGWLVRKHGLSCDNVISFELVTAEGEPADGQRGRTPRPVLGPARRRRQFRRRHLLHLPRAAGLHGARRVAGSSPRQGRRGAALLSRLHGHGAGGTDCLRGHADDAGRHAGGRHHRLLVRRHGRRRTRAGAVARLRPAAARRHPADALPGDAEAAGRGFPGRHPQLLEGELRSETYRYGHRPAC